MYSAAAGLLALAGSASAVISGMNYASSHGDGSARTQADFETYFKTQKALVGSPVTFNSARLYTMIQAGTTSDPISAIDAALTTDTTLLLGLWASGDGFQNELNALKAAIAKYGDQLGSVTAGISVGSEDLYRNSPTGIAADAGLGKDPDAIVEYISQVRAIIKDTAIGSKPVGHVDTWNDWVNGSNKAVVDACDFIGLDAYPYFESTHDNQIANGKQLFMDAMEKTKAAVGDKEVWVTETGWPISGDNQGAAIASVENAQKYWQSLGCSLFSKVNTWWYILADGAADPSFAVVNDPSSTTPLWNLTCPAVTDDSSSTSTSTGTGASSTGTSSTSSGSGSGSGSGSSSSSGSATTVSTPSASATTGATASATGSTDQGAGVVNGVSVGAILLAAAAGILAI